MKWTEQEILDRYAQGQRVFRDVELEPGDLRKAVLTGIVFEDSWLAVDFSEAVLYRASFIRCNIKTCNFRHANLRDAHIIQCSVEATNFAGAMLMDLEFKDNTAHGQTLKPGDIRRLVRGNEVPEVDEIGVKTVQNTFSWRNFYVITVNGKSLEHMLVEDNPNDLRLGLVPAYLNWLDDSVEREIAWKRALPAPGETSIAPILMCSEDADLSCDVVTAEVSVDADFVYWERMGTDASDTDYGRDMEQVGTEVIWLKNFRKMKFRRVDYEAMLEKFRRYLDVEGPEAYPPAPDEIVSPYEF